MERVNNRDPCYRNWSVQCRTAVMTNTHQSKLSTTNIYFARPFLGLFIESIHLFFFYFLYTFGTKGKSSVVNLVKPLRYKVVDIILVSSLNV